MRSIVAILLLSVVLSASAQDEPVPSAFNTSNLTKNIATLTDLVKTDYSILMAAVNTSNLENIVTAVAHYAQDIPFAVALAREVLKDADSLIGEFISEARNLSSSKALHNILRNYVRLEKDIAGIMDVFAHRTFKEAGLSLADIFQIILFGNTSEPIRKVRQLAEKDSVIDNLLEVIIFAQGFFEQANTNVNATDFEALVNDVSYVGVLVQPLLNDIKTGNFSGVIADLGTITKHLLVVRRDIATITGELGQWINRDIPYYSEPIKVVLAVNSLLENWNVTEPNVQNVANAFNQGDFEGTGSAVGVLYNEFYGFLSQ